MTKRDRAAITVATALAALLLAACQTSPPPLLDPLDPMDRDELNDPPEGQFCGGFAGIPCPEGYSCIDDPSDDCDPQRGGGADCAGICVPKLTQCDLPGRIFVLHEPEECAATLFQCPVDFTPFFDACGCGCDPPPPVEEEGCRENVCARDQFCCNWSCGICAPLGGSCIQVVCD